MPLAAIAADELRAARSSADKQGQNLAGVLPTLPPTEALVGGCANKITPWYELIGRLTP